MSKILQLKIILKDLKPTIWRKFLVEDSISFCKLHEIIQSVMGWENYHHYEFEINGKTMQEEGFNPAEGVFHILTKSPEFQKIIESQNLSKGPISLDITKLNKILKKEKRNKKDELSKGTILNKFLIKEGITFNYLYDFGDNWDHSIFVEKILDKDESKTYPTCIEGARACPPEDSGGVYGYEEMLGIKKNKKHPRYKELIVGWLGKDFDPEKFSIEEVNKKLKNEN